MIRLDPDKVPIPTGRKRSDLTLRISQLHPGDSLLIGGDALTKTTRAKCFVAAERLGIQITTRETEAGLRVWRLVMPDDAPIDEEPMTEADRVPEAEVKEIERQAKIAALRDVVSGTDYTVAPPVEDDGWIEDPQTFEDGQILYWHHKPKCKPICYRRESDLSGGA